MNQIFLICHQKSYLENQITTSRVFIVFLRVQNLFFVHTIVYIQQVLLGDVDLNSY